MARPGRPRRDVSSEAVATLRARKFSWREISRILGVGYGTAYRAYQQRFKTDPKPCSAVGVDNPNQ